MQGPFTIYRIDRAKFPELPKCPRVAFSAFVFSLCAHAAKCCGLIAKDAVLFDERTGSCSNMRVQYLVYVHNLAGGSVRSEVISGDAPAAPPLLSSGEQAHSYVNLWIDSMESDPLAAMRITIEEALEWPREHGEKILHMTATTSLEMELGPNFDEVAQVIASLERAMSAAAGQLAKSA